MDLMDCIAELWKHERPELDTEPMVLIGRLMRVSKCVEQELASLCRQYSLKTGEFDVLASLLRSSAPYRLTPSELTQSLMLTSGAMTHRLDRLESKKLIARYHSNCDRRCVVVQLTQTGYDIANALIDAHVDKQKQLVSGLSLEQRQQTTAQLKVWLEHVEKGGYTEPQQDENVLQRQRKAKAIDIPNQSEVVLES
ncbi:HTH-type transcriptional regulator MhqR [Vibrio mediterranei]|nr:MarR family transcriptional regulator [Vibrio mediterranei]SBO08296.1 HTH-type transcriptional regulator MhqR [Vibrio mediterranei]